jgi:Ala-tRNA(Pro) deacylase
MTCLDRLEGYLRENRVPFQMEQHHHTSTAHQVAVSEQIPDGIMAKVVMVFADGELTMLVIPADHYLDLADVALILNATEVRLATEAEFAPIFADCEVGAMPPFGNLYGVPVYMDTALAEDTVIVFQAGTHTEAIGMASADYIRLVQPMICHMSTYLAPELVGFSA